MFFVIVGSLGQLAIPAFSGIVIDLLVVGDFETIQIYCLYMLFLVVISGLCTGMRSGVFNILEARVARNMRRDMYNNLVSKDI